MSRDRSAQSLLGREPLPTAERLAGLPIRGRSALVTGAAGSVGSEICHQLLRGGLAALTLVDLAENPLYLLARRLEREFPHRPLAVEVADIRDEQRVRRLVRRAAPRDVFHAAALKQLPLLEAAPCEAVKTNVLGTEHVASAADAAGVERFVYISTDKAARPSSVMGASKRIGEEVVRGWAGRSPTAFCAVRFGNVLGSAGSVTEVFEQQIAAGGPLTVTHRDARRFFMTVAEAVSLVLEAGYAGFGDLCVLDMGHPVAIVDLARRMIRRAGLVPGVDIGVEFVGLRPGEKLEETLLADGESLTRPGDGPIAVVRRPPPATGVREALDELRAAAGREDEARVLGLMRRLVPDGDLLGVRAGIAEERAPGRPGLRDTREPA